jgi:hypothetical protein
MTAPKPSRTGTRYRVTLRDGRQWVTRRKSSAAASARAREVFGCQAADVATVEALGG